MSGAARVVLALAAVVAGSQSARAFATLAPETAAAFDRYVEQAEGRMTNSLRADRDPELKAKLRAGEVRIESGASQAAPEVPGGMVQDWVGMMFLPQAKLDQVKAVLQDYANYKNFYQPRVIESKEIAHRGEEYDIFLRLYEKHVLTVVLNATYHVQYAMPDPGRMTVTSRSTRIAEVKDPGKSYSDEYAVGNGTGFLWRLNSYWRFEAADGGVYAECEAISLSRDVPLGLGWMLGGFLQQFPKESMQNTLRGTKAAVANRVSGTTWGH